MGQRQHEAVPVPVHFNGLSELFQATQEAADHLRVIGGFFSRGGGIRTHDLFVPNEARYQAAPHPVVPWQSSRVR